MLSVAFQRRSIQNNNPATRPSRLMSMTLCRDGWGGRTCLRHVPPRVRRAEARLTSLECRGPFHDTNTRSNKKPRRAESAAVRGGKLQSKGLGFGADCRGLLGCYVLLTHRNLRHAGQRLKRAFRFCKFFGYFLPKKVTTRNNLDSAGVTAWAVTPKCKLSRRTPVRFFCPRRYTKGESVAIEVVVVGTCLRHVLSVCGVETPR
jgi:hypothetical protein